MFIEIQEIYTIIQCLYTYYIIDNKKFDSNNKVSIDNCCHAPKIANDKKEAVQLMYLSKNIMSSTFVIKVCYKLVNTGHWYLSYYYR